LSQINLKELLQLNFTQDAASVDMGTLKLTQFLQIKGALNPNFLNLTINREKICSRYVLVSFLNLILLKSCKRTSPLTSIPKSY